MLTSVRSLLAATLLAGTAVAATPALAQEEDPAVTVSGSVTLVTDYRFRGVGLSGGDNLYLSADAGVGIPNTPVSLSAHVGYTDGFLTFTPDGDAFDYSIGGSVTVLNGLSIGVAYVGVDGPGGPAFDGITDDTVVGTLGFAF